MPDHLHLILPQPETAARHLKRSGPSHVQFPSPGRQRERLSPKFERLESLFERRAAELRAEISGVEPEEALVLETVGTVDGFVRAVRLIPGLEWLGEWDETGIEPDEDFFDTRERERGLGGRVYLVMSNQEGMRQLVSLWNTFREDPDNPRFAYGRGRWGQLFRILREVRPWGPRDRLYETGLLEDLRDLIAAGEEAIGVEIELWHRSSPAAQATAERSLIDLVERNGGEVLGRALLDEIAYHALLTRLPIEHVRDTIASGESDLVRSDHVMYLRPVGQAAVEVHRDGDVEGLEDLADLSVPEGGPIAALLDGVPLENHVLLRGRLVVDDPEGWTSASPPDERIHGTAMASLVIHGDLSGRGPPLSSPLYVRPVLLPDARDWRRPRAEVVPEGVLPIDLVHRAIRRLFESEDGEFTASAPSVRVVNLSVADRARQLDRAVSPWARLLDYLAWKYRILFVVSAGNHSGDITLDAPREALTALRGDPETLQAKTVDALNETAWNRRLLSPAEAVNAITVGAASTDDGPSSLLPDRFDPLLSAWVPAPYTARGPGFRRSVKPDVLFGGGRQLFMARPGNGHANAVMVPVSSRAAPGVKVACPGLRPGDVSSSCYDRGTSHATALASRAAVRCYHVVERLADEPGGADLVGRNAAVLLKAMLVHGAHWGEGADVLREALGRAARSDCERILGYGRVDPSRILASDDHRATLVGVGELADGDAHRYSIPLPPSLSGVVLWRRVIVTLAWLTPVNPRHRGYRGGHMWFTPYGENAADGSSARILGVARANADWQTVKRGTVQHEIFEGELATAFREDESLQVQVNCAADALGLEEPLPYALVGTVEVREAAGIPVYEEIRARIRQAVRV